MTFDDSDDDLDLDEENSCFACLGNEDWGIDDSWIGCGKAKCNRWFHKSCISDEVCKMSKTELAAYQFFCRICEKK